MEETLGNLGFGNSFTTSRHDPWKEKLISWTSNKL